MADFNKEEIQDLMRATVRETLRGLGADVDNPLEMQQDFQSLREWRTTMAAVRKRTLIVVVGTIAAGLLAAIWLGLKNLLTS